MTITFYTNPMSRGQIARWALHEAGADYDQVLLDYGTTMKDDAYLAVNPMGKVPAIVHDGKTVTECAAICAYLADTFPEDRKSTRLNSSHVKTSYAVFCLKKKNNLRTTHAS